jgi:hypothetical protein
MISEDSNQNSDIGTTKDFLEGLLKPLVITLAIWFLGFIYYVVALIMSNGNLGMGALMFFPLNTFFLVCGFLVIKLVMSKFLNKNSLMRKGALWGYLLVIVFLFIPSIMFSLADEVTMFVNPKSIDEIAMLKWKNVDICKKHSEIAQRDRCFWIVISEFYGNDKTTFKKYCDIIQTEEYKQACDNRHTANSQGQVLSVVPGWKTYLNNQYNFSLQYPGNWELQNGGLAKDGKIIVSGIVFLGDLSDEKNLVGILVNNPINFSFDLDTAVEGFNKMMAKNNKDYKVIDIKTVDIGGKSAKIIESTSKNTDNDGEYTFKNLSLLTINDRKLYSINSNVEPLNWDKQKDNIENSLMSFRFIK